MARPIPTTLPPATPIGEALTRSAPLARLQALMRESHARFELVRPLLPGALSQQVRPGPVDEEGWSLLAANTAVAAKLRQLVPRLEAILRERGLPVASIRIRIVQR
jgi:hypothetical protein